MAMESLCEEEDEADEFFSMCLPLLIEQFGSMSRKRKRQEFRQVGKEMQRLGRGGKKGRKWQQRKKGQMRRDMFAWSRLLQHPDVADVRKKMGKVHPLFSFYF